MRIFVSNQLPRDQRGRLAVRGVFGVEVATRGFYRNLIRFGKFDEYRFFILPDNGKHDLGREFSSYLNDKRIKFHRLSQLPAFLNEAKRMIFFASTPAICNMINVRSIYARRYFPVCGMTHTISYASLLRSVFFHNMVSDLRHFDSIICTNKYVLESVDRIHRLIKRDVHEKMSVNFGYKARLDCLPLGINAQDYSRNNKAYSRKILKLPAQKTVILYFGRFSVYNKADLHPLLLAFKKLRQEDKNILLVLAGENFQDNYGGKLKKMAEELGISQDTRFFFNVSGQDQKALYSASDIFVSPSDSLQESFGLTLLEAMSAGLAVVVSDWDGYKDIVRHGKTGFLVPTYWSKCTQEASNSQYLFGNDFNLEHFLLGQSVCVDVKKIIEYIRILIKNKELRLKLGFNARKRIFKHYDWSVVIPKYEMLWDELMESAGRYRMRPKARPFLEPDYFTCFNHYSTHILNKDYSVAITDEGIRLLKTRKLLPIMPPPHIIAPRTVLLILFYLKDKHSHGIKDIEKHLRGLIKDKPGEDLNYYIMWMMKHYLIKAL